MTTHTMLAAAAACLTLSACCTTGPAPVPSSISFGEALSQVTDGIKRMQAEAGEKKTGLVIAEATVTFNITASQDQGNELKLDLAPATLTKVIPTGSVDASQANSVERGNQITMKFINILTATKDTAIGMVVAPQVLTSEKTVTTDKDGKTTTVEKTPVLTSGMSLERLTKWADESGGVILNVNK